MPFAFSDAGSSTCTVGSAGHLGLCYIGNFSVVCDNAVIYGAWHRIEVNGWQTASAIERGRSVSTHGDHVPAATPKESHSEN